MIKNLCIVYIEGFSNHMPKQEKNLFNLTQSVRFWKKYFTSIGYNDGKYIVVPKEYLKKEEWEKYKKIIDKNIKKLFEISFPLDNKNDKIEIKLIITGDYDEIKSKNSLKKVDDISKYLYSNYNNKNIFPTVKLEKSKKFKIEWIMEQIVCKTINKSILRKKVGTESPNIEELLKAFDILNFSIAIDNLKKSTHPLFQEINNFK